MIRVSRRTDYAVRVLLYLAIHESDGPYLMHQVADEMLIPLPFVKRIIADLVRAGLVKSQRGSQGGLWIARNSEEITLLDIVEACNEPVEISPCIDDPDFCPLSSDCPVRRQWARLRAVMRQELKSVTIAQLAQESTQKQTRKVQVTTA